MQFLLNKGAIALKNFLKHLYQENIEANGIFKKKKWGQAEKNAQKLSEQIYLVFITLLYHVVISVLAQVFRHTVHTLVDFHTLS